MRLCHTDNLRDVYKQKVYINIFRHGYYLEPYPILRAELQLYVRNVAILVFFKFLPPQKELM